MSMRNALAVSSSFHVMLGALLILATPWSKLRLPVQQSTVEIDYVVLRDENRVSEAPRPSLDAAPRETAGQPDQAQADAARPDEALSPEAVPPPRPSASAQTERLDARKLENLIDKRLKEADRKPLDVSDMAKQIEKAIAKDTLVDSQASANLAQAVRQMVERCWNPPMGAEKLGQMWVTIRLALNQDGTLNTVPELVGHSPVRQEQQALALALADSARRAVIRCAPYALPAEQFRLWRELELRFDPSQMSG